MKKKILVILLIICSFSLIPFSVSAQNDEEEPSPSPDDERIKQQVQERIENVLKASDEKKKQALIGTLKAIANSTLTIETKLGDAQAKIATDAAILDADRKEIELEDLVIGSKLISMGYADNQNVLETKRIIVREEFQTPETEPVFGIVTDISNEEKVLTIKHPRTETVYMVEINSQTTITQRVEKEIEEAEFSDIKEADRLVAVGEMGENGEKIITAKLIHIITPSSSEE